MIPLVDLFVIYKFVRLLSTPWKEMEAYKLGLIDEKGKPLVKRNQLKTQQEKMAYTIFHVLVWNLKRLLERVPGGNTRIGSFAAALWLIKEETQMNIENLEKAFTVYLKESNIELPKSTINENLKITKGVYQINETTVLIKETPQIVGVVLGMNVYRYEDHIFTADMIRRK